MNISAAKLCLNMIVKDEAANIERCLRAVADHVSCWVIGDTGSTDGTQELIRGFFAERGIPGELHSFPFETFGQARNAALDLARASPLSFDYLLFADADMELTVSDPAFARGLTSEAYLVRQDSGVAYWNIRLVRRDADAAYIGVTHEYLDLKVGRSEQLAGVAYIDHASGTNRDGKFARDAALLSRALETERDPGLRARYTFYLANSLRDDGDLASALTCFEERARLGMWQEEVFVSLLNVAELKARLDRPLDEVLGAFETAAAAAPTRAEALHGAARLCREKSLHERGYGFAVRATAIPLPQAGLFVHEWIYRHGTLDELAVNAYWAGRHAECVAACDRLLAEPSLPEEHRGRVQKNRLFALDRLRDAKPPRRTGAAAHPQLPPSIPPLFHFITGLDSSFGGKPFSFVHAMAVLSALRVNPGFTARVYYEYEPQGPYWDLVKRQIDPVPIVAPREFCGHPVAHFANKADICRLRALIEHGGIYLDIDTICQKPFAPLLDGSVVMGLEKLSDGSVVGLCNATIIAPPQAPFLKLWLNSYNDFTEWNRFAVQIPMQLARQHPDMIRIEPATSFFWPPWDERGIAALFATDGAFPDAYSFHLWESKSWEHLKLLDADRVRTVDTAYNRIARRFLSSEWQPVAAPALAISASTAAPVLDPARGEAGGQRAATVRKPRDLTPGLGSHADRLTGTGHRPSSTSVGRAVGQRDILDFIAVMRPMAMARTTKVRIGNNSDGGYVLPASALQCDSVLSIGVGFDVSFDFDLAVRGAKVAQFDHTIERPPIQHENFTFFRKGWGAETDGDLLSFADIQSRFDRMSPRRALLKFDIEGFEYQAIGGMDVDQLRSFEVIVCEFHNFQRLTEPDFYRAALTCLEKLTTFHAPVHLHANNYGGLSLVAGIPMPCVVELSFLRRDLDHFSARYCGDIPGALDYPNNPSLDDIVLTSF